MSKAFCKKLLQLLATERRAHTNSNDSNTRGNHEKIDDDDNNNNGNAERNLACSLVSPWTPYDSRRS